MATRAPQKGGDRGRVAGRAPSIYYLTLFGKSVPTPSTGEEENRKQIRTGVFKNKMSFFLTTTNVIIKF